MGGHRLEGLNDVQQLAVSLAGSGQDQAAQLICFMPTYMQEVVGVADSE